MPNSIVPTNLGEYQILPDENNSGIVCNFTSPYGSFGSGVDPSIVTAWGINQSGSLPCLVILQLNANKHYIIPYAVTKSDSTFDRDKPVTYPVLQAIAYDLDQAYTWMFNQGSLGAITYQQSSGLVFDNTGRWAYMSYQSHFQVPGNPTFVGFNGTGIPDVSGYTQIRTKRLS